MKPHGWQPMTNAELVRMMEAFRKRPLRPTVEFSRTITTGSATRDTASDRAAGSNRPSRRNTTLEASARATDSSRVANMTASPAARRVSIHSAKRGGQSRATAKSIR